MIKLYEEEKTIECVHCGKDIIKGSEDKGPGILIIIENDNDEITKVIPSCKGQCDDALQRKHGHGGWRDISDFKNPLIFMQNIMAIMNLSKQGKISEEAFATCKEVFLTGFQYVLREPTKEDWHAYQIDQITF